MQYYISHYNKEPELNFPDEITVYDTTLRDGEQTPGVCFSPEEKLEIAKKLDEVKIKQIEAGFPIVSKKEQEALMLKSFLYLEQKKKTLMLLLIVMLTVSLHLWELQTSI